MKTDNVCSRTPQAASELGLYTSGCCSEELIFDLGDTFCRCPRCEAFCNWELESKITRIVDAETHQDSSRHSINRVSGPGRAARQSFGERNGYYRLVGGQAEGWLQDRQSTGAAIANEGIHARQDRSQGMPCRPEHDDHSKRRNPCAMLPKNGWTEATSTVE
jgi:hypothetical protein